MWVMQVASRNTVRHVATFENIGVGTMAIPISRLYVKGFGKQCKRNLPNIMHKNSPDNPVIAGAKKIHTAFW